MNIKTQCSHISKNPRIQEFVEKLQQQKLLVGLLVVDRYVHPNIDGGHILLPKVEMFLGSDLN